MEETDKEDKTDKYTKLSKTKTDGKLNGKTDKSNSSKGNSFLENS